MNTHQNLITLNNSVSNFLHNLMILYYICIHTIGQFLNEQYQINCSMSHSVLSSLHRKHVKEGYMEDKEGEWRYPERQEATGGSCGDVWRVVEWWYSMWQTPGTHASSTFHAAQSPDAGLACPSPPPRTALCARIISKQWGRRRWSHPREGSPPPPSSISLCLSPSACILSLFSP